MEQRSDEALAQFALIQIQAEVIPSQVGYWEDLRWKQTDSAFKLGRIMETQTEEIQKQLREWAQRWL